MRYLETCRRKLFIPFSLSACFCLLLFASALPFLSGFYPIVSFTGEEITIHVNDDHVVVEGRYVYKNPFPFPVFQGFSIPFPVDHSHPNPVLVTAEALSPDMRPIPVAHILGAYRFEMPFRASEEILLKTQYRQQAESKNACYILTTTKSWRRPLVAGTYRLLQNGVKVTASNYPLKHADLGVLIFQREGFMPEMDWHFAWEVL